METIGKPEGRESPARRTSTQRLERGGRRAVGTGGQSFLGRVFF